MFDLARRPRLARLPKVADYGSEQPLRPPGDVIVDGVERGLDVRSCLLCIEEVGVHRREELRIQLERLGDHLSIDQPAGLDHLDLRQGRGGVQDPQGGVIEIAARDEPLVRLRDRRERMTARPQELDLPVASADLAQPLAEVRDGLVVRVEQPPFREQRVHERVVERALDDRPKLSARHQKGVHVDPVGIDRDRIGGAFLFVDRHERQVDVGLRPDRIVRQAAAENRGEHRSILPDLLDQRVERSGELLLNGFGAHAGTLAAFMECNRMASWPCSPVTKILTGGGENGRILCGRSFVAARAARSADGCRVIASAARSTRVRDPLPAHSFQRPLPAGVRAATTTRRIARKFLSSSPPLV